MSKPLTLSKYIPGRTKTVTARWCKKDFTKMDDKYREIRARMGKPLDSCWWCGHEFVDGETIALAAFNGTTNKVLCQACAAELLASSEE